MAPFRYTDTLVNVGYALDQVEEHEGDVIRSAGDGLLAAWAVNVPGETGGAAAASAEACAAAVGREMNGIEVGEGLRLFVRMVVAAGPLAAAHVGGVDGHREFVLGGLPFRYLKPALARARPGETIVVGLAADATAASAPPQRLPRVRSVPPEAEATARSYLPPAILDRIAAGLTEWLGELRRASVLFVN